jgi:hypothetical protein
VTFSVLPWLPIPEATLPHAAYSIGVKWGESKEGHVSEAILQFHVLSSVICRWLFWAVLQECRGCPLEGCHWGKWILLPSVFSLSLSFLLSHFLICIFELELVMFCNFQRAKGSDFIIIYLPGVKCSNLQIIKIQFLFPWMFLLVTFESL